MKVRPKSALGVARRALLVATLGLALAPGQALAHGGNPDYRSVIDSISPPLPTGVSIEVLDYDSYFQLVDRSGHEVVILGYENEPYARIEKDGTVQVNQRSPATFLNDNRFAEVTVPASADPKAAPEWKTVDQSGTFIWHDHRMHWMSKSVPAVVTDKGKKTKVFDYSIPLRVDGTSTTLHGSLWWVGGATTSKLPFLIGGVVIVLAGLALVIWTRRRRDGGDAGGDDEEDRSHSGRGAAEPVGEAW